MIITDSLIFPHPTATYLRIVNMKKILITLISLLICSASIAAPKADLWPRWQTHNAKSTKTINHDLWAGFLNQFVQAKNGVNLVNYGGVSSKSKLLHVYITNLIDLPISQYNRNEQMAYWINLYNALTVQVILQHYPVDSILDIDISPGFFSNGPWDKKLVTVEGEAISLNDIEHRILRPIWKDPRIHYAVNCASMGCPNLAMQPYQAGQLEAQLNAAATAFINHPRGVSINNGEVTASKIYHWYGEDFGNRSTLITHWQQYANDSLKEQLNKEIDDWNFQYDWALNDQATAK